MRRNLVTAGALMVAVGVPLSIFGWIFAIWGPLLVLVGLVLVIVGAVARPLGAIPRAPDDVLRPIIDRLYEVEGRLVLVEDHLRALGERVGVPPPSQPSRGPQPMFLPPPPAAAPSVAVAPPPLAAPAPPRAVRTPQGISRLEQQLGEKWFLWIGIVVLVLAFAFFLAIVLRRLTPEQTVGVVFAGAMGLALLSEVIFSRKKVREYAKALEAGAFGIAYVGVWGGGFFFGFPGFPWEVVLGAVLALHAAAALRYRSPLLGVEVGLVYLAWAGGLRALGVLSAADFAVLLASGAAGALALGLVQRDWRTVLALALSFDGLAVLASPLLVPYGFAASVSVGLATAAAVTLLRHPRSFDLTAGRGLVAWLAGIALAYGALLVNAFAVRERGGLDDLAVVAPFAAVTAAFTVGELLLRDRGRPLPFAATLALLTFPFPLLMARGEIALLVFPAVLGVLAATRKTQGLAWFTNVAFLGLLAFVAGGFADAEGQKRAASAMFFGLAALHLFLQLRSGHGKLAGGWPVDVPLILYAVALVGLSARAVPGPWPIALHMVALPVALLLNRGALLGPPRALAVVVLAVGFAAGVARGWALAALVTGFGSPNAPYLAAFHVGLIVALGAWIVRRKAVESLPILTSAGARISWPALALLSGLSAQGGSEAHLFAVLPLATVVIGYVLDDGVTFSAAYLAAAVQVSVAVLQVLRDPAAAVLVPLVFLASLLALGFVLELGTSRRLLARTGEATVGAAWAVAAAVAFGADVQTTVALTVVAAVAVGWGLWRKFPELRYIGFALFFAVLGKVFLYDIAGLDLSVRVLALIIVAACLLAISYGYARFRRREAAEG